jgi:alpha-tubulin suppressor-like RCC1 family protein
LPVPHVGRNDHPDEYPTVKIGGKAVQIVAGDAHTCVLLEGGAVRCWGAASNGIAGIPGVPGSIGDDEHPDTYGPVQIGGLAVQLTAGAAVTCALLETGAVRCWGQSQFGQLGIPGQQNIGDNEHPSAVPALQLGGTVSGLEAGFWHTCAQIANSGGLRCWGENVGGQLGLAHTNNIGDNEHPATQPLLQMF